MSIFPEQNATDMINDLQTWSEHPDPPRQPPSESELALISTIKTYTEAQTASLSEVTNIIASPIEALYAIPGPSRGPEAQLWKLYTSIFRYARTIPSTDASTQNRLIDIISSLKSRPEPLLPTPAPRNGRRQEYPSLWNSLVVFGAVGREEWNEQPGIRNSLTSLEEETEEWTSVKAFCARLTETGVYDFSLYGFWAMRDVVEVEKQGENDTWVGDKLDVFLPAAASWILIAGERLWGKVSEGGEGRRESELSRERWLVWKERFSGFAGRDDLKAETRKMSERVVEKMGELESKSED
jgi:hypothetical protein